MLKNQFQHFHFASQSNGIMFLFGAFYEPGERGFDSRTKPLILLNHK